MDLSPTRYTDKAHASSRMASRGNDNELPIAPRSAVHSRVATQESRARSSSKIGQPGLTGPLPGFYEDRDTDSLGYRHLGKGRGLPPSTIKADPITQQVKTRTVLAEQVETRQNASKMEKVNEFEYSAQQQAEYEKWNSEQKKKEEEKFRRNQIEMTELRKLAEEKKKSALLETMDRKQREKKEAEDLFLDMKVYFSQKTRNVRCGL
eukprot:TRINITY_DN771_c0_g2_i10.p1 TRINITY_DN771_c0_g2~~TRINITY_DN771_c0_g2_i10.p1  ORF type:complete len:207 (+),score=48.34 TRINITY_DN771_c0_g2_i10:68-688(+)